MSGSPEVHVEISPFHLVVEKLRTARARAVIHSDDGDSGDGGDGSDGGDGGDIVGVQDV